MPTYEYVCNACDHRFEHFQSMTSSRLRKCPACGTPKLRRLIGAGSGVLFKGSGFYSTDYRSESYKKAAKDDSPKTGTGSKEGSSPAGPGTAPTDSPGGSGATSPSSSPATRSTGKSQAPSKPHD